MQRSRLEGHLREFVETHPQLDGPARSIHRAWRSSAIGRFAFARSHYASRMRLIRRWALQRTELDNFYYDLTELNRVELASTVALVCGVDPEVPSRLIDELRRDAFLRTHVQSLWAKEVSMKDAQVAFGRRMGWYAFVRILKPRLVVETGVHQGVGSCVVASALLRNAEEGSPGRYLGTDINPHAGILFRGAFATTGDILYGDSIESLRTIDQPIDVFINDSDHSAEYEAREYETVAGRLSEASLVLGDNSHVTSKLQEFAWGQRRPYLFFAERPEGHWYPGGGIGISPSRVPLGGFR